MGKLTAVGIRAALKKPGRYADGDGLFLEVGASGSASWIVRVQKDRRRRDIGLGSLKKVPLAKAREGAALVRSQVELGHDPVAERQRKSAKPSFAEVAMLVHGEHKRAWKNGKHREQWLATLRTYAFPALGALPVDRVETGHVRDVLGPIWIDKPETARRLRQRIGAVLDYAVEKNWRQHPIDMRAVSKALPRQPKKDGHFSAMPYADVPALLAGLRERVSMGRLALEALILTAARSGEIRGARWEELDLEAATWTVPAGRMKSGKTHVVPLSPQALDVFERARALRLADCDLVFPGATRGRPLSDMTLLKVLRDAGHDVTVHGFRSAFRDWAAERTHIPGEVAEAALAHAIPNRVEAAYRRTDFFEKRRELMDRWGAFCAAEPGKVIRLAR